MASGPPSLRENRCWRIAQFKNNWGDLHQIDVDTLDADPDPLMLCSSSDLAIRWACKSPLRRRSSPSPTQSLALSNATSSARSAAFSCAESDLKPFCECGTSNMFRSSNGNTICKCGEPPKEANEVPLWQWQPTANCPAVNVSPNGRQVHFHQGRSVGTAAVRGSSSLMPEHQHFWEVKLTSPMFGTDVMIGVGTDQVNLRKHEHSFCSMLGEDSESWGLSYSGIFQHGGECSAYAAGFGRGCIVGIHLDSWHGQLSFFVNRRPLGVACKANFTDKQLFPMLSSTAARTSVRLLRTRSCSTTLQYLACKKIRELVPANLHVLEALPLPPGLCARLKETHDWLLEPQRVSTLSCPSTPTGCSSPLSSGTRSPEHPFPFAIKRRRLL